MPEALSGCTTDKPDFVLRSTKINHGLQNLTLASNLINGGLAINDNYQVNNCLNMDVR